MIEDWIRVIGTVLQTASIVLTAMFAIAGLEAWRRQMVGKRRMEVAEQLLSALYRYRDAIQWIRSPGSFGNEGSSRPRDDNENEDEDLARQRNMYFVPLERIKKEAETLSDLLKATYLARVYFSESVGEGFLKLKRVLDKVTVSAGMLIRTSGHGREPKQREKWEADIWSDTDNDQLGQEIREAIATIEAECRPCVTTPDAPFLLKWLIRSRPE